ncbi:serine protease inhibitor Kazal-type 6-like isoform X1 [Patiria miniata]|uniref:Kazal-like domain-containing protein n=1 Tax=Patiria miniata TaxID=46514 RepID=A0A914BLK5_PATMI|nr:serine protease inhibitor Kazal-type 6-like isoform X1 [Patiria miniata]
MQSSALMLCIAIAIAVAFSASFCEAVTIEQLPDYCDEYSPPRCFKILWPVCASNGKTYDNLCLMCAAILRGNVPTDATYQQWLCPGHRGPHH